jgi:hypothetical protein
MSPLIKDAYFDMLPNEIRDFAREPSTVVDGARRHLICGYHATCKQDTVVVVTEGGGLVDDASTVSIGDVTVNEHSKAFGGILCNTVSASHEELILPLPFP